MHDNNQPLILNWEGKNACCKPLNINDLSEVTGEPTESTERGGGVTPFVLEEQVE